MTATDPTDDQADDTATVEAPPDTGPAIGRRKPEAPRAETKPLTLYSYDSQGREKPHPMTARPDELDYATLVAFTKKDANDLDRMNALHHGLRKVLCDDDGIPAGETVRTVVERDGEWVDVSSLGDDDVDFGEIRFVLGDQVAWESVDEAREHGFDKGSSQRRFEHLTDPSWPDSIDSSALEDTVRYLLSGGGPRPTRSSRRSSGSRRTKKTRSGAG